MAVTLRYFTEFGKPVLQKTICGGIYARVYCILVRVQCRRKDLRIGPNLIMASALDSMLSSPKVKVKVVVKKVHVRYVISWWVSCIFCHRSLLGRPTLDGKVLSFTHERSFFIFFIISPCSENGHQMYSSGGIEISPAFPWFSHGSKMLNLASFITSLKFQLPAFESAAIYLGLSEVCAKKWKFHTPFLWILRKFCALFQTDFSALKYYLSHCCITLLAH